MLQFCAIFVVFPISLCVLSIVFTLFVQIAEAKCCSGKENFLLGAEAVCLLGIFGASAARGHDLGVISCPILAIFRFLQKKDTI